MPFKYPSLQARLLANSKAMQLHDYDPARPWTVQPCRIWTGFIKNSGYGQLRVRSRYRVKWGPYKGHRKLKTIPAHRLALALHLGLPVWTLNHVLHECDNKPCIEPTHLRSSTQLQNVRECVARGRHRNRTTGKLEDGAARLQTKPLAQQGKYPFASRAR